MPKPIQLIVATAENRVIGRAGRLPFDIPEDKRWFHDRTANQVVVLGRICFETWPHVLQDGRKAVVISSHPDLVRQAAAKKVEPDLRAGSNPRGARVPSQDPPDNLHIATSVSEALAIAQDLPGEIMVCGGQRIYEETLPIADRLLLTLVHATVDGDTYFPEWRQLPWHETWRKPGADANYRYTFSIQERIR